MLPDIIEGEEFKTYYAAQICHVTRQEVLASFLGNSDTVHLYLQSMALTSRVKRKDRGRERMDGAHTMHIQSEVIVMVCLISKLFL